MSIPVLIITIGMIQNDTIRKEKAYFQPQGLQKIYAIAINNYLDIKEYNCVCLMRESHCIE